MNQPIKNGPEEGLRKKLEYWNSKDKDITIAQAVNLAQNHIFWKYKDSNYTPDEILKLIRELYPKYLEILLEAKEKYNPKNNGNEEEKPL